MARQGSTIATTSWALSRVNAEESFVRTFVVPEKRQRYLEFLSNPKRRGELLDRLNHAFDYEHGLARELTAFQARPHELVRLLRAKGAGEMCHVIADQLELDGKDVPLAQAVETVMGHEFGAVICCTAARLAYYKPESPHHGFVLEVMSPLQTRK